jgi:hypothetical protein
VKRERLVQTLVVPPLGRVVRYKVDLVGNDLTATLRWCETHHEPVWVFGDGSYECPQARVIEHDDGSHVIVDPPWEGSP